MYIHIYVQLNHSAVHLKLIQHCKSTIFQLKKLNCNQARPYGAFLEQDYPHVLCLHFVCRRTFTKE